MAQLAPRGLASKAAETVGRGGAEGRVAARAYGADTRNVRAGGGPMRPRPLALRMNVGVVGAGAMGMGVVRSLLRGGFAAHVRDVRPEAHDEASRHGAACHPSPAALARACDAVVVLVVDSAQIEDVLFGRDGIAESNAKPTVLLGSTVAPGDTAAFAARLAGVGVTAIDAPVSGGPQRAADGTMTMMLSGAAEAIERCGPVLRAIAGKVFVVGTRPGDAAKFKIVNNMLAAANLAAAGEAIALAERAGLDLRGSCTTSLPLAPARRGSSPIASRARSTATTCRARQRVSCARTSDSRSISRTSSESMRRWRDPRRRVSRGGRRRLRRSGRCVDRGMEPCSHDPRPERSPCRSR